MDKKIILLVLLYNYITLAMITKNELLFGYAIVLYSHLISASLV